MLIHKIGYNSNNYFDNKDISFNAKFQERILSKKNPQTKPNNFPPANDYGIEYFTKKTQNVQNAINKRINEKIGEFRITKLFTSNGVSLSEIHKNKDFIKKLANIDYQNVEEKYTYFKNELQKYTPEFEHNKLSPLIGILDFEELTQEDLDTLHKISKNVYNQHLKFNKTAQPLQI